MSLHTNLQAFHFLPNVFNCTVWPKTCCKINIVKLYFDPMTDCKLLCPGYTFIKFNPNIWSGWLRAFYICLKWCHVALHAKSRAIWVQKNSWDDCKMFPKKKLQTWKLTKPIWSEVWKIVKIVWGNWLLRKRLNNN